MKKSIFYILFTITSVTAAYGAEPVDFNHHTDFYDRRTSLFEILPVDSTSIVFLGNSLTNGCEWHELLNNPKIVNRGISADVVAGVDERLGQVLRGKPSKVFLMIGVNDVSHHLSVDSIVGSYTRLIEKIRRECPATRLYVQSSLPVNNSFGVYKNLDGKEDTIRQINALMEEKCVENGVVWINLYDSFADDNGNLKEELTNDGLHLLGNGYIIWRDLIEGYVNE